MFYISTFLTIMRIVTGFFSFVFHNFNGLLSTISICLLACMHSTGDWELHANSCFWKYILVANNSEKDLISDVSVFLNDL